MDNLIQGSKQWFDIRRKLVTASDCGTILGLNRYQTKRDLLVNKVRNETSSGNEFTNWGTRFEPVARNIYEKFNNCTVKEYGIFIHQKYNWLGGSPDGIVDNKLLLEIKCPYRRKIIDTPMMNYWVQCQILMECCNIDIAHLFECKFRIVNKDEYDTFSGEKGIDTNEYWVLEKYTTHNINRNKTWFSENREKLYNFWKDANVSKKRKWNGIETEDQESKRIKTRQDILLQKYTDWSNFTRYSDLVNYINDDPLLDWLNLFGDKSKRDKTDLQHTTMLNKGNRIFRNKVYNYIINILGELQFINESDPDDMHLQTVEYMNKECPFIANGTLVDSESNRVANYDLLVRGDKLKEFVNELDYDTNLYVPIVIESVILNLRKDDTIVDYLHKGLVYKSHFNETILSAIQKEKVKSFVLAKNYKTPQQMSHCCFHTLGEVRETDTISDKITSAIEWKTNVKGGKDWTPLTGDKIELYPNMKNKYDFPWSNYKKDIAKELNEVTMIWNCGVKDREHMEYNWATYHMENNADSSKKKQIIKKIIDVNKRTRMVNTRLSPPSRRKIKENYTNVFVDFETAAMSNCFENFPYSYTENFITTIGIGHMKDNKWVFKSYNVDRITKESEYQIVNQFMDYISSLETEYHKQVRVLHWSHAELSFLGNFNRKFNCNYAFKHNLDLLKFFMDNKITVKDSYDFKLKSIARALCKYNKIQTEYQDIASGFDAMCKTIELNEKAVKEDKNLTDLSEYQSIIKYNEIDCKVLQEIFEMLKRM